MVTKVNSTVLNSLGNLTVTNLTGNIITASQPNITALGTLTALSVTSNVSVGNLTVTSDARIGGNTVTANGGYKTLTIGGSSGGGWLQFLTNGTDGPYIYNTTQNLVLWTSGGAPKIVLGNAAEKYVEITGNTSVIGNLTVSANIVGSVNGFSIGYRDLPQLAAGNVTLALADAGKHYYSSTNTPYTITVPSNANVAFTTGTTIVIINKSTANISIAKQSAVSLYTAGNSTSATRTLTSYGMATLIKTESDVWFINGTGVV